MTKAEIKTLCEADDTLQWWAMVMFAELCEVAHLETCYDSVLAHGVRARAKEFKNIVLSKAIEKSAITAQEVTP